VLLPLLLLLLSMDGLIRLQITRPCITS